MARHIAARLRALHADVDVINVKKSRGAVDLRGYAQAFVVASVHVGHHEKEMIAFVRRARQELMLLHASFISLTLSQAGAENPAATDAQREQAHADALRMIEVFAADTGWRPARTLAVAGALRYSQYNFFLKMIMKHIAHKAGFDEDVAHDYEFTNWSAIDRFVSEPVPTA